RTFYPLSDGPSTRDHRITSADFRLCAARRPCSQAGFCACTRRTVSDPPVPTIARLRSSLGGDRPSQTARHAGSRSRVHGPRLDVRDHKGGISRMPPPQLAPGLHRLPPILHMRSLTPLQSCSKGARGLSVCPRVLRIFTESSISLSRCWRQRGSRYAIRAGRNLPDKEFRYLRTVIVTAAVYRGFDSELAPLLLTFRHRAGVRPYTSSCDFAEPCVFSKQSPPPLLCPPPLVAQGQGPLLPKLRGHFAEFLQHRSLKRLGMLYQSTSGGFGYGLCARAVSWKPICRHPTPVRDDQLSTSSRPGRLGNINPIPIGYGFRPRLR